MSDPISADLIDALLALDAPERQISALREAGLLDGDGLGQLLDQAAQLAREDPGKAGRLAGLCAAAAEAAAAPAIAPRASYLQAQSHAVHGGFAAALALLNTAQAGFQALGDGLAALRTNLGLMHVLNELGRHDEVLAAGQALLDGATSLAAPTAEIDLLLARARQNMGVCYETTGRYAEALAAYEAATAGYQAGGLAEAAAQIDNNRGVVLLGLGRAGEALTAFQQAETTFAAAGQTLLRAQALVNGGNALLLLGRYSPCLEAFEQARRLLSGLEAGTEQIILLADTAYAYLALNLFPEAVSLFQDALEQLERIVMARQRARALWGLGAALIGQGQLAEAEAPLAEAAALFAAAGNLPMQAGVLLEQAALLEARADRPAALALARQTLDLLEARPVEEIGPIALLFARLRLADLLLPDAEAAEAQLLAAGPMVDALALPHFRFRINQRLGRVRRLQGRDLEAQTLLEAAIDDIEGLRATLVQEAMRTSFLDDKTAAYEELLRLHLDRGGVEELRQAFALAERAKSRTLLDLLSGALGRQAAGELDAETAARLQALQADLDAIYSQMLAGEANDARQVRVGDLQARANAVELAISRLRLQETVAMGLPASDGPAPILPAQAPPDTALIAFHILGDEIMAFCLIGDRLRVLRRLSSVPAVQASMQRLAMEWERFRAGQAFVQRHLAQLERSVQRVLAALHGELMAPIEALLDSEAPLDSEQATRKLVIVPHGLLHQLPFQALFDGQRYLLDYTELSLAPSATVLALCQGRVKPDITGGLVMGVSDEHIPAAIEEARLVARHLPGIEVRVNEAATLEALKEWAGRSDIVHLACHGLFRADNPRFSALHLSDGWLLAADAAQLNLPGALVTLSACESGRSQVVAADEPLGLARAFLGAGAASVVVSLWLVHDESTAQLMDNWYRQLGRGLDRAAALRSAQMALRTCYAHPYYWAPFVLIGGR